MTLLQATAIEDYFSSSPLKKHKHSPHKNTDRSETNDSSPTTTSSPSDFTQDNTKTDAADTTSPGSKWKPRVQYDDVLVSELKPGFRGVRFMVRVVNVFEQGLRGGGGKGGGGNGARGCSKLLGRDESGVLMIHLYYADTPYDIGLGTLITVWTPYVSKVRAEDESSNITSIAATAVPSSGGNSTGSGRGSNSDAMTTELMTSIFPERDGKCHVKIHREEKDRGLCRAPVGCGDSGKGVLDGVVSLGEFMAGSRGERLLVFVKALGEVVTYTNKGGKLTQKIDVGIEDESGEAIITLFGRMMLSALKEWVPSSTILLITRPNSWGGNSRLSVSARTMIEIDPDPVCCRREVEWLKRLAGWSGRGVNERFPEEGLSSSSRKRGLRECMLKFRAVFDIEAVEGAVTRVKFTLADIDDFIRTGPKNELYMGYLNVLLTEVNLVAMFKANRLFSAECCSIPLLYGNAPRSRCGHCGMDVELRLNPQIIGAITDETGTISSSPSSPHFPSSPSINKPFTIISNRKKPSHTPLLWSHEAWHQLLGREPGELSKWRMMELRDLEARLRFLRVTILFGWQERKCGGRLAVCRVVV